MDFSIVSNRNALPRNRALIERIVLDLSFLEVANLIGDEIHTVGDAVEDLLEADRIVFDDTEDRLDADQRFLIAAGVTLLAQHLDARHSLLEERRLADHIVRFLEAVEAEADPIQTGV